MKRTGAVALLPLGVLFAQRPWRKYPAVEYNDFPIPADYQEKTEWAFARLMYPNAALRAEAAVSSGSGMCADFYGSIEWGDFRPLHETREHADNPDYAQEFWALGIRIGIQLRRLLDEH